MSKLKETFATRRSPVPQFIVELVYNPDGTEKNEEEFIIDLQNQLLECSSKRNPTVLTQWTYLIMSLYRFMERHIETLQEIKTQGYTNMQELNSTENKIIKLLETLKRICQQTTGLINTPFPYFGQLLDLTWNSQILINLTQIGLEHLLHTRHQKSLLENLAPLFNFWTPFSRLLHHYGWDFPELNFRLNELSEANENKDERLRILREHFIEVFQDENDENNCGYGYDSSDDSENDCDLWSQVKSETLPLYDNKYIFVSSLASELRENSAKKIKDSNIRERYYILGKALFTFFITNPVYDELFFSQLLTINAFQGLCNHCIQKNDMYEKNIFQKAKCYKSDYYTNYLLLPDPIFFPKFLLLRVKRLEEIKENEDELLLRKMTFIMNIFIGLNSVIAIIKSPNFEDQSKTSLHTFMREFMCMNNETSSALENKETRPVLSEIFKIIHSQYESDCAIKKSLDLEPTSQLLYSISTQVPSILMYHLLRFNASCVFEMTGHLIAALRAEDNTDGFRLGYFIVVHGFIVGLLQLLKNCGFEYQHMSLDVLDIAFSTLADFCNHTVTIDTQICVLLSKILENRIKWTTTNEFCEYFRNPAANPEFLQKLIQVELDHLSLVLGFPSNKKLAVDMRMSYLNHICTFETIDFISAYEPAPDVVLSQFALKSQEQLIRSYLTFNLRSQIITYDDRGDQFVYYSFERLQQIWKIITKYSSFEFNMIDEFNHSYKIIKFTIDSTRSNPRYYKVFDLDTLSLILSKCLFNLSAEYDLIVFDNLKQVLGSFYKKTKVGYDNLLTKFSVCLQETFEDLFNKMDHLQNLYLQGNALFNKEFLITENKLQKLIARLFRFLDILPEVPIERQADQVFLINPPLNQVIINSLSKLLLSPVSHTIGFVNTVEISNFISRIPPADKIDLLQNVLAQYAQKLPAALALVEKELAEKPVKALLERKLEYYDTGSLSIALNGHQFFGDTVYDNLREIHAMNSVLFPALMLGSLEAREFIVPEKLRPLAEIFVLASSQHLMEIVKSTLNIRFFLIRDNLREDEDVSQIGDVMGSDDDFYSWYSIPFIRDYLTKKALILVHFLNNPDPTKTPERNFGVRLAALLTFEDMASKMQSNDLLDLLTRDEIAENILKALLQNIFDFCEIVSNNVSNPLGEYVADSKIQIKDCNELYKSRVDLNNLLWSILRHSSILDLIKNLVTAGNDKQIKSSTSKKQRKSLRESILRVIDWSLDKIDDQLLILILLMTREEQSSPFAQLLECIYVCYETVLTQLINFETHQDKKSSQPSQLSYFGRMDEEQISNYGGSVFSSQSQSRLTFLKQTYLKFLSKFIIFSNIMEYAPRVPQSSRDVIMELFEGCKSLLKTNPPITTTLQFDFGNSIGVQIYEAEELSDFRTSVTMLFFLSRFKIINKIRNEEEYKYYIGTMRLFLVEIGENMKKLQPDLFLEEDFFIQKDFMPAYREIINSLIFIGEQMLLDGLETHAIAPDFYEIFDLLCLSLKKLHEICQVNKAFWSLMKSIFETENLMLLFYASLFNPNVFEKFCLDAQILEILVQNAGKTFYSLAEIYALQAFDPQKILPLKLKALVSLDKSGNNIIYNNAIKNLQIYYPQTLSQVWLNDFTTQDFEETTIPTKTIIIKQTSGNVFLSHYSLPLKADKTQVPFVTTTDHHQEQTILIPSLTYLKEGMSTSTKYLLSFMMNNIVSLTQSDFQSLLNDLDAGTYHRYSSSRSSERTVKNLHNTISCLSVLLRNYPELSVFVINHELGDKVMLSQNIPDLTPILNDKETFLTYFIKYVCYFYNFSVSYLVEDFVRKSETTIYVTYKNEPILLSTYNEIQIFHVILKLLEETLQHPAKLLKTLYSCTIWTVLANISIKLLSMEIAMNNEKNYRLEIIKSLDFLCTRGLQLFYKERESSEEKNSKFKNSAKIFYGLKAQLAELEMSLKTKNYLLTKDQASQKCSHLSFKNYPWIGSILKEQFYLDADPILSSQQIKNFSEIFQPESWPGTSFLKSLPPFKSQGIEPHVLTRMLRKIQMRKITPPPNLGNMKLFEYSASSQEHLRQQLSAFDSFSYFYPDHKNDNKQQSSICNFITKYDRIREDAAIHLREFAIRNWSIPRMPCLFVFENMQKPDRYHLDIPPKFHLFLKRTLKPNFQKNHQMIIEEKKSNPKNANLAKSATTSFMFKQSDLENMVPTIEENKARIKLLLHQHDEKVIMAKFQAALNQTVNITHLLSLEVETTNQDFFDKQTDSDKELILMLANPHFIDSLTEELKQKSRVYKKAIDDKKRADAEAEVYTDSSDDDDEIEVEDDDSESEYDEEEQQEHVIRPRARIDLEDSDVGEEEQQQNPVIVAPENPLRRNNDHDSDFGDENPVEPANLIDFRVSIAADSIIAQEMEVEVEAEADGRQNQNQLSPQKVLTIEDNEEDTLLDDDLLPLDNSLSHPPQNSNNSQEDYQSDSDDESEAPSPPQEELIEPRRNYDRLADTNCSSEPTGDPSKDKALSEYKEFLVSLQSLQKFMVKENLLPKKAVMIVEDLILQSSLEEWVAQIFYFLTMDQKEQPSLYVYSQELFRMDNFDILSRYLMFALLDPVKEAIIIPLFTLSLIGYQIKLLDIKSQHKTQTEEKILYFFLQYALRSPSIFFRVFEVSWFEVFIASKPDSLNLKTFSVLDIIAMLYAMNFTKYVHSETLEHVIQRLLDLLLQIRFTLKVQEMPEFVQTLHQKEVPPLKPMIIDEFYALIVSQQQKASKRSSLKFYCRILQHLACLNEYRKGVLTAAGNLLRAKSTLEQETIINFVKSTTEKLENGKTIDYTEQEDFHEFLAHLKLTVPEILRVFTNLLEQATKDNHKINDLIEESENCQTIMTRISICYMDLIELVDKLQEKDLIDCFYSPKKTLKKIIELLLNYYAYTSGLKELAKNKPKQIETETGTAALSVPEAERGLLKRSSDQDSLKFHQVAHLFPSNGSVDQPQPQPQPQVTGDFQEIFARWVPKVQEFIGAMFHVLYTNGDDSSETSGLAIVKKFPRILSFDVKDDILRESFNHKAIRTVLKILNIRRDNILEDSLKEFESKVFSFRIKFIGEAGIDAGGLKKEFLTLISKELFDPLKGLFKLSSNKRTLHPNPMSILQPDIKSYFRLAGIIIGLAIKEKIPVDVNFSRSFLKLLMNVEPGLNDLEDIEPELTRSLRWMLTNDVTDLEQDFTYELNMFGLTLHQELQENGSNITVTENNKESFISKICLAKTLDEVEPQIQSFKQGLFEIFPEGLIRLFSPGELGILISGKSEIDIKEFKKYTKYSGFKSDSQTVVWFWEIVEKFDQNMLANLLFFITGSPKIPHGGFKDLPIVLTRVNDFSSSLPVAHTCFGQLDLPIYQSKEQLHQKLLFAINEGKEGGFFIA